VLNILDHKGNANQSDIEIPPYPSQNAIINTTDSNKWWQGYGGKGTTLLVGISATTIESSMEVPRKMKNRSTDPVISFLGIYLRECAPGHVRATCTPLFIASLFTVAKLWKQSRFPQLVNELRKCGIYTQLSFIQP
jgi:hypothetical protein